MFTGIVEAVGRLQRKTRNKKLLELTIQADRPWLKKIHLGDSICVSGVCLTAAGKKNGAFIVQAVPETVRSTNLNRLKIGDGINLERSLRAGDPLGGHFVTGHIDGVGQILGIHRGGEYLTLHVQTSTDIMQHIVPKGAIALEGISLTVQNVDRDSFKVAIIPFTLQHTSLNDKLERDWVNLETDILSKYVAKCVRKVPSAKLTVEVLREQGY